MGIFNSKNLKKAVNIVASYSPVINAISQASDIVDKCCLVDSYSRFVHRLAR